MNYITLNLKENLPTVELALAQFEIELERAKEAGIKLIKIIHGYGSSGQGGKICLELRVKLEKMKRNKQIGNYFLGNDWNLYNDQARKLIIDNKVVDNFPNANPGITIVVV